MKVLFYDKALRDVTVEDENLFTSRLEYVKIEATQRYKWLLIAKCACTVLLIIKNFMAQCLRPHV